MSLWAWAEWQLTIRQKLLHWPPPANSQWVILFLQSTSECHPQHETLFWLRQHRSHTLSTGHTPAVTSSSGKIYTGTKNIISCLIKTCRSKKSHEWSEVYLWSNDSWEVIETGSNRSESEICKSYLGSMSSSRWTADVKHRFTGY